MGTDGYSIRVKDELDTGNKQDGEQLIYTVYINHVDGITGIGPQLDPLHNSVINLTKAVVDLTGVLTGLRGDVQSLTTALRDSTPLVSSPAHSASNFSS